MKNVYKFLVLFLSFFSMGCSMFGVRKEETPKYTINQTDGAFEVRDYSSYIVAKTTVKGDYRDAQKKGFRILANYIFGDNVKKQKISMTAPVEQSKAKNEKIAMTAPVTLQKENQSWTVTFMMPSKYKLQDLPTPTDKRVKFEKVNNKRMAAFKYTGLRNHKANLKKQKLLQEWIEKNKLKAKGNFITAGYDPPWTLPFLRKNELLIEIEK